MWHQPSGITSNVSCESERYCESDNLSRLVRSVGERWSFFILSIGVVSVSVSQRL